MNRHWREVVSGFKVGKGREREREREREGCVGDCGGIMW